MYTKSISTGKKYDKLERTIIILISDYNLEKLQEIPEYVTKWNIREEKYQKIILTDALEIYIIELSKVKKNKLKDRNELETWLQFINNPEEEISMENKEINQAKKVLKEISADEHEQWLADLREKYILDQQDIEDFGYDKGLKAGIEQKQIEIVKKMKQKGIDTKTIAEITELTEEEIDKILS